MFGSTLHTDTRAAGGLALHPNSSTPTESEPRAESLALAQLSLSTIGDERREIDNLTTLVEQENEEEGS